MTDLTPSTSKLPSDPTQESRRHLSASTWHPHHVIETTVCCISTARTIAVHRLPHKTLLIDPDTTHMETIRPFTQSYAQRNESACMYLTDKVASKNNIPMDVQTNNLIAGYKSHMQQQSHLHFEETIHKGISTIIECTLPS